MTPQVFVLGNSRSGTTMLARILASGTEAADLRELHFIEQMVTGQEFASRDPLPVSRALSLASRLISIIRDGYFKGTRGVQYQSDTQAIVRENMSAANLFEAVRYHEAARLGRTIPIDQTPRNVFYIPDILRSYETARIVCMVRDPRDVCLSQKGKWRRRFLGADIPLLEALRSWANYHPLVTAKIWAGAVRAGDKSANDPRVLIVKYEDIALDPETTIRKICMHCGITFVPEMLNVKQLGSSDRKDQAEKTGVDASRVGTWEKALSGAEISIIQNEVGDLLDQYGYKTSDKKGTPLSRALWTVALLPKMSLSLLLNLNRVKSLSSWARKRLGYK